MCRLSPSVPYQVLLDTGGFIYAPSTCAAVVCFVMRRFFVHHSLNSSFGVVLVDDDDCIKRSSSMAVPLRFDVGDMVTCKVEEGWEPGMIASTE